MTPLVTLPRDEFIERRFRCKPGEHVTIIAPTTCGKTTMIYDLLGEIATPRLPVVSLVMKPRDKVVRRYAGELGHRVTRTWPPLPTPFWRPPGWVLWPRHTFDPDRDDVHLQAQFRKCMLDCYQRGNRIIFVDEVAGLTTELGLSRVCKAIWMRGASMHAGLWAATQRPREVPLHAYSQAHHLLLGKTPDKKDRDRFSEIGGVDPDLVKSTVAELQKFQWLYIRREDSAMCIVDRR